MTASPRRAALRAASGFLPIVALMLGAAVLTHGDVTAPPEMEWDSSLKWRIAAIVNDVLVTTWHGTMTGYRLPSLEKRWERNVRPQPVDRITSLGAAVFIRDEIPRAYLTYIEPPTGCERYQIAPPHRPGGTAFTAVGSVILESGQGGLVAHMPRGGEQIWRAPIVCGGAFEFSGGLHGRVLATCPSESASHMVDLVTGRTEPWRPSGGPGGNDVLRCPDARNLDGAVPPPSSWSTIECLSGGAGTLRAGTQDPRDEVHAVLRGLDRRGRLLWQTSAQGRFRDLTYVDPGRAILQTDAGMLLVRTEDGREMGPLENSAGCRVYGAYGGKLVSKVIGEGTVKIHDLETRSLLATVGEGTVGQTILARGSPYLVLLEDTGVKEGPLTLPRGYWLVYRLGERGAKAPITMIGRIPIHEKDGVR